MNAVATLCDRVLLLDKGTVKTVGTPHTAISAYNDLMDTSRACAESDKVNIEQALALDQDGEPTQVFASGNPATICVRMRFHASLEHVVIAFVMMADGDKMIFGTNTMRLGGESLSVDKGDLVEIRLNTNLHLAPGTYGVRLSIFHYHMFRPVARRELLTLLIKEDPRVTGFANLNPVLGEFKKNGMVLMEGSRTDLDQTDKSTEDDGTTVCLVEGKTI
jgi:hypothetical protein